MVKAKKKPVKGKKQGFINKLRNLSKKKIAFLSMAGLLLLLSIGNAGYGYYKLKQMNAEAGGWTYFYLSPDTRSDGVTRMRACKVYKPGTGYGNLYQVKMQAWRDRNYVNSVSIHIVRNGKTIATPSNNSWLYGVVAGLDTHVSKDLNDKVAITVTFGNPPTGNFAGAIGTQRSFSPASLKTC